MNCKVASCTLKKSVFSAIYLRLPWVRGGLITTATLPWFGLRGCSVSTLFRFSPVTRATDWVIPTKSIIKEIVTPWTLKSLACLQAFIRVWSHNGGCTCSQSEIKIKGNIFYHNNWNCNYILFHSAYMSHIITPGYLSFTTVLSLLYL